MENLSGSANWVGIPHHLYSVICDNDIQDGWLQPATHVCVALEQNHGDRGGIQFATMALAVVCSAELTVPPR